MPMEENELVVVPKVELAEKDELIKSAEERCQKLKSDFTRYKKSICLAHFKQSTLTSNFLSSA